ncbi:hypothetical protein QR680_008797 [Steinernema hermaphroditum]|uniref:Saposin B-type domain-containing protein n=1 Tax=Steinernema hermaphroditum TaxID=289476 RepID=A0AA39M8J6_9BILA|nr:hypothetical protein QR680_008797 [Steinernema hermaphroditum]
MLPKVVVIAVLVASVLGDGKPHWPGFCHLCSKMIDEVEELFGDTLSDRSVDEFEATLRAECDKNANGAYGHICLSIVRENCRLWYKQIEEGLSSQEVCWNSRFCN